MNRKIFSFVAASILLAIVCTRPASAFCFEEAGHMYNVSPTLLWAIAKVESNFNPAAINKNSNGSFDFGVMQINSSWYRTLGADRWNALGDACQNVKTGAWILSQCMASNGYTWDAVGCYNAVSKEKRRTYSDKIKKIVKEISDPQTITTANKEM